MAASAPVKARQPEPRTPLGPRTKDRGGQTDPYMLWAEAQNFRGYAAPQAKRGKKQAWRHLSCVIEFDLLRLRAAFKGTSWRRNLFARYGLFTPAAFGGTAQLAGCSAYTTAVVRTDCVLAVQRLPYVRRLVMSLPRAGREHLYEDLKLPSTWRPRNIIKAGAEGRPVMAVIDIGQPVLSSDWLRANGSRRLCFVWDQDVGTLTPSNGKHSARAKPWRRPSDFGYGRELVGSDLLALVEARERKNLPTNEASMYAALLYPAKPEKGREARGDQPAAAWAMPASTHGAQCAGVAASPRMSSPPDAAADADLIFVQLPHEVVSDTTGAGLASYALDALRYIVERTDTSAPLVVNLSYGAAAGPHDGSTVLEKALAQLLQSRPGMAVVVPAGNLHGQDGELGADATRLHARVKLQPGAQAELAWAIPMGGSGDHFIEWWPRGDHGADLKVSLAPGFKPGDAKTPQAAQTLATGATVPLYAAVHAANSPLGDGDGPLSQPPGRPMVLTAVSQAAPHGRWTVTLHNDSDENMTVDGWIERADPGFGNDTLQSYFPRDEAAACRESTLSTLANGEAVIVAGGLSGKGLHAPVSASSASGPALPPSHRLGPDYSAPCEGGPGQPWTMVPGFAPGTWVAGNGTSLAAPAVARWVLNRLAPLNSPGRRLSGQALNRTLTH